MLPAAATVELVDHHCHGISGAELDRDGFELLLTEADTISPLGGRPFDSAIGLAVRRWCAPVLDLPAHSDGVEYLARRAELGATEVNRRFLRATGIREFLVDDGIVAPGMTSAAELGELAGARTRPVVRLEQVAEDVVRAGTTAAGFADAVRSLLADRAAGAVGCKSIAAYRAGLELSGDRPAETEVRAAAGTWLATIEAGADIRLAHETLHRFLLWCGIDLGLPVQIHAGFGDADLDLRRADPLLLTDLFRASRTAQVPIVLLHNYPFHRNAAYLAQVYDQVFLDLSLTTHNAGRFAGRIIAETMEIAPFGKILFGTDAYGLAELYYLGALLFRRGLSEVLRAGIDEDSWSAGDADRIAGLIGADNARRVYQL